MRRFAVPRMQRADATHVKPSNVNARTERERARNLGASTSTLRPAPKMAELDGGTAQFEVTPASILPTSQPASPVKASSVTWRLNLLLIAVTTTLLGLSAASEYLRARAQHLANVDRQVTAALNRGAKSLPSAVWNFDTAQIQQIITAEMDAPFVLAVEVANSDKTLAVVSRNAAGELQPVLLASPPKKCGRSSSSTSTQVQQSTPPRSQCT